MGMDMSTSNQMLLFQGSKSPIINNNFLVIYSLPQVLLILALKDWRPWWKMAHDDVWEVEDVGDYNRN